MKNRENDAVIALDIASRICQHFDMKVTLAKLNLI